MVESRTLPITVPMEGFYGAFLEIFQPKLLLRRRDRSVLAELLYQCYLKRDINLEDRFKLVFGYEGRQLIQDKLNITSYVLSNSLLQLRKKGLIVGNTIQSYLLIDPKEQLDLTFSFKIQEDV